MLLVVLSVSGHRLDGSVVHPLRADVEPVLLKFFVAHRRRTARSLFFSHCSAHCRSSGFRLSAVRASCMLIGLLKSICLLSVVFNPQAPVHPLEGSRAESQRFFCRKIFVHGALRASTPGSFHKA